MSASASSASSAREVVLFFVNHLNGEKFAAARKLASDDLSFVGVLGSRDGADAYFSDMKKMHLRYVVKKVFAEGADVCLFADLTIWDMTIFCSSWYRVERGKIKWLRVIFDPRPSSALRNSSLARKTTANGFRRIGAPHVSLARPSCHAGSPITPACVNGGCKQKVL
jgi:hypothetical protein